MTSLLRIYLFCAVWLSVVNSFHSLCLIKFHVLLCRFSDEEPQYLSSSSADVTCHSRDTSALATLAAGGGSSATRKAASAAAKSDTLKRKAVGHNNSYQQQTLPSSSAAAKSETLKRKTDGHHQIFGTAEFNSRNRRKSVAAAAAGESTATLRRKSEDRGSEKIRGGGGSGVSAAEELSEYLLRQSAESSSYGLFSRKSATDKVLADTFTTVHFSEIPRPKLLSTGGFFSCGFVKLKKSSKFTLLGLKE
jgi:hypothetical protein